LLIILTKIDLNKNFTLRSKMSTEEQTLGPECPICLEKDSNICLPCGSFHWVHRKCWEQVVDKTKCLICKQSLKFISSSPYRSPTANIDMRESRSDDSKSDDVIHEMLRNGSPFMTDY